MGRDRKSLTRLRTAFAVKTFFLAGLIISFWLPSAASARMHAMTDSQLSSVTGSGFSQFTLVNGTALAEFDVRASTYTQIDTLKLGYYNNGAGLGWDQNWTGVSIGTPTSDLVLSGFYLQASFQNISDPATRQLQSVTIGWKSVTGTITADFSDYSGYLQGTTYSRGNLGNTTVTLNNEPLSLTIDVQKGIEVNMGN